LASVKLIPHFVIALCEVQTVTFEKLSIAFDTGSNPWSSLRRIEGSCVPLLFTMLDKRGNSNSQERTDLINRFIRLFDKEIIESVVADREFVGKKWLEFLNRNNIR
jgi:hypothetical protein